ncbi:group III truncated hemoglobin [Hymenobacter sp. BT175]|uniref:group III truncated hemoglobin n=1 Tax=Hymenobacter translucens TaxID=2886507 RepID=UPI001D0EAA66|nr:group III truncated hemoglobin [Hymenobacter translucens]MCC2547396.1 group III truncated hemoglobin [Hymenobacter translucens]
MPDIETEADIRLLVDSFYDAVNQDELLSAVFNGFAHVDWARHLPVMYDFWSSVLLGTSRYKGRPFAKHIPLPVGAAHFQRWLQLFFQTVDAHFRGPKAEDTKARALSIASMFEHRLTQRSPLSLL